MRIFVRAVRLAAVLGIATAIPAAADPITVTNGLTAAQMVQLLLGASSGITVVSGSESYQGAAIASGSFSGGTGILPFDSGIALTSGSAQLIPGPNDQTDATQANGTASYNKLDNLAPGTLHGDAAVLSFSFIPSANTISFQYVFGSEEYNEFVGSQFNDVFGFFLALGSNPATNLAVIPNTSTPISVNTVNSGTNADYFTDNTGAALNIQYDGLVGAGAGFPLFATASVIPGQMYTINLGVEDSGSIRGLPDLTYDSGVMLAAGSFKSVPVNPTVPEPATILLVGPALALARRRARRR